MCTNRALYVSVALLCATLTSFVTPMMRRTDISANKGESISKDLIPKIVNDPASYRRIDTWSIVLPGQKDPGLQRTSNVIASLKSFVTKKRDVSDSLKKSSDILFENMTNDLVLTPEATRKIMRHYAIMLKLAEEHKSTIKKIGITLL